jgi:hypothetical protein
VKGNTTIVMTTIADFRSKINFWLNFSLLETFPSPRKVNFLLAEPREKRHLGFRQVWACLSAVSVPVLLQFTDKSSDEGHIHRTFITHLLVHMHQNQRCNWTLDGQVNVLSWLPDWASCLSLPQKAPGIFKFMFSLLCFILHVLDSIIFCGPKLDLRQYNIAI